VNRFLVKFPVVKFDEYLFRFSKLYVDRQTGRHGKVVGTFLGLFCIFALYQLTTTTIIIMSTTLSVYIRGLYETSVFVFTLLLPTHFCVIHIRGNFVNK